MGDEPRGEIMAYAQEHVGEIDLKTENHGELHIDAELDTLDMLTITFGHSFTLRVDEDSVDLLREMLYDVSRRMAIQRSRSGNETEQACFPGELG
jgi:hypothetical protein